MGVAESNSLKCMNLVGTGVHRVQCVLGLLGFRVLRVLRI